VVQNIITSVTDQDEPSSYVNFVRTETTNMPTKFTTSSYVKVTNTATRRNSEAVSDKDDVQVGSITVTDH
jgi:hypothetical protein